MQSAESGLLILPPNLMQRRVLKIKRILSYSRDTKVSHKVVLAYFHKHYWLIANGFCPYCHNHYRNFGILANHIMRSHTLEVAEDYFTLRAKIKGCGEK
ncbi:hypothetical protein [Acidianus two-tailed virus 2]|nr:hypothetical protein [Acidianus two-tailed virus 2]